ncbi:MAG: KdsC family phosphatase [Phycisphaerales bacterium]
MTTPHTLVPVPHDRPTLHTLLSTPLAGRTVLAETLRSLHESGTTPTLIAPRQFEPEARRANAEFRECTKDAGNVFEHACATLGIVAHDPVIVVHPLLVGLERHDLDWLRAHTSPSAALATTLSGSISITPDARSIQPAMDYPAFATTRARLADPPSAVRCIAHPWPVFHESPSHFARLLRGVYFERQRPRAEAIARDIQLVVFDFDGVMTDNAVIVTQDGQERVRCNRSDGMGIGMLKKVGIEVMVLSMEENPVVQRRCDKLKIPCIQGQVHKLPVLERVAKEKNLRLEQICYVGNDVNDLECLEHVGLGIAVADAWDDVLIRVRFATRRPGGNGAVREVCDLLRKARDAR